MQNCYSSYRKIHIKTGVFEFQMSTVKTKIHVKISTVQVHTDENVCLVTVLLHCQAETERRQMITVCYTM